MKFVTIVSIATITNSSLSEQSMQNKGFLKETKKGRFQKNEVSAFHTAFDCSNFHLLAQYRFQIMSTHTTYAVPEDSIRLLDTTGQWLPV